MRPASEVKTLKTYEPRERWNGRRGWNGTVTVYTTLGSIADFITDQRRKEADGTPECAACGKRGNLHLDNEDGLMKCYGCCDIPA